MSNKETIKQKEYNVIFYKLSVDSYIFNQKNESYDDILTCLKNNAREEKIFDINGCKAYVNFIKENEKKEIYLFYFEKYRQEELPQIENIKSGNTRNISLGEDEAITEKTCFALCFNHSKQAFYIAYIKLQHSYEPSSLLKYISKLAKIKEEYLNLSIVLHKDTLEKLYKHEKIVGYSFKIAAPNQELLKNLGISRNNRFLLEKEKTSVIAFEISLQEPKNFTKSKKEKINKLLSNNTNNFEKFIISVCSNNQKREDINLFQDIFKDKIKANINNNNAINLESIGDELIKSLDKNKNDLDNILMEWINYDTRNFK